MNFIPLLLFWVLYQVHCVTDQNFNDNLLNYLNNQVEIVNSKLNKLDKKGGNGNKQIQFIAKNELSYDGNRTSAHIFMAFNNIYVLLNQKLYMIKSNELEEVHKFRIKSEVVLIKTIQHDDINFVLIAEKAGAAQIWGLNHDSRSFLVQMLDHPNISDATFFINEQHIYLLIGNWGEQVISSTILYKFTGTHFDEIETLLLGARKLLTFEGENGEEIVIVFENSQRGKFQEVTSIFKFKSNSLRKIQRFRTTTYPDKVLTYTFQRQRFIVIIDGSGTISRYLWTGSEIHHFGSASNLLQVANAIVMYQNGTPIFVASTNGTLLASDLMNFEFELNSQFNTNMTQIIGMWSKNDQLVILGLQNNGSIVVQTVSLHLPKWDYPVEEGPKDVNAACLTHLEKKAYSIRAQIRRAKNKTEPILTQIPLSQVKNDIANLESKFKKYESMANTPRSNILTINHTVIVKGSLQASKVTVPDIYCQKINDEPWSPNEWMLYSKAQTIQGAVKVKRLNAIKLQANKNKLFNDLLLNGGNQTLTGKVAASNLNVHYLESDRINGVPFDNIYLKSNPMVISGTKRFKSMKVQNSKIDTINGMKSGVLVVLLTNSNLAKYKFNPLLKIDNLWVDNINGIDWKYFASSVYRVGKTLNITGDLTFINLTARRLHVNTLNRTMNASRILTISTDQIVGSSLQANSIVTRNIDSKLINGIDFGNAVATFDSEIYGPVKIENLSVKNNFEMKGKLNDSLLSNEHIVGTNESDSLQIYNGKVTIEGNLILNSLNLDKIAKLIISDKEFDQTMQHYWTKSSKQVIPNHVAVINGISTPHLFVDSLNGVSMTDYMLNSREDKPPTTYYFENVTVRGNVILNRDQTHVPDLRKTEQQSVRIIGQYQIKGRTVYRNLLKIDHFEASSLNGVPIEDFVHKNGALNISKVKQLKKLRVRGNLIAKVRTEIVNGVNVTRLQNDALYIDDNEHIDSLNFKQLQVKNLRASTLNNWHINSKILKLEKLYTMSSLDDLYIQGDVDIKHLKNIATINDIGIQQLLRHDLVTYRNGTVYGKIEFLGQTRVDDLETVVINDVVLPQLFQRLLYKNWTQEVTKPFKFKTLKTKNLVTPQINDINVTSLVDVSIKEPQIIVAPMGLKLAKATTVKSVRGNLVCGLEQVVKNLHHPSIIVWDKVVVNGNATVWDEDSVLLQIFENAVLKNQDNIIMGTVNVSAHTCAKNVNSFNISGVNINEIVRDALLIDSTDEQVVTGRKTFVNLKANNVQTPNTTTDKINNRNITEIDSKLITRDNIHNRTIRGSKLFFGGLQTKQLYAESISGVRTKNLVSTSRSRQTPHAIFDGLNITGNLVLGHVNKINITGMLDGRLLVDSTLQIGNGKYFFNSIKIENAITPQINDIKINNVVFDDGIQNINGSKKFLDDVRVNNSIKVGYINGLKLSDAFDDAVLGNRSNVMNGTVNILRPSNINGNITTNSINNIPVSYLMDIMNKEIIHSEFNEIERITSKIQNFVTTNLNTIQTLPTEYLYLEKSSNIQIAIKNTVDAKAIEMDDSILIHIETEEPGDSCNLPTTCKCPAQYTVEISPHHSINPFMNKGSQRIYSYSDDTVTTHFITNSISTSSYCRTNTTKIMNEVSYLTWNARQSDNANGSFRMHPNIFRGYVSNVEFFTSNGYVYVVIGKYYDPVWDKHDLDATVLRFTKDKSKVEEIQRIETRGVKVLLAFYTAQGVVLIVGNSHKYEADDTDIYRFDDSLNKFVLLRKVQTFECTSATGIALGEDSFIVVAKSSDLQIFKYQHKYDNYYFYESLHMDYQVLGVSQFYSGDTGISNAHLCVITENNEYFIFSFRFIEGWKLESKGELDGIRNLIWFKLAHQSYLFVPSAKLSSLLAVVKYDSN